MCTEKQRKNMPYEAYAARKSKEFHKKGVSNFDKIIFAAKEKTRVSGWMDALQSLEKIVKSELQNSEEKGVFYWLYGACLKKTNNLDLAEQYLTMGVNEKVKIETYVTPFCLVELAELEGSRNKDQARKLVATAKSNFKEYDFQTELTQRMARLSDTLNGVDYKMV